MCGFCKPVCLSRHLNWTHLSDCVGHSVCAFVDKCVWAVMRLRDLIMLHACQMYLEYASSACVKKNNLMFIWMWVMKKCTRASVWSHYLYKPGVFLSKLNHEIPAVTCKAQPVLHSFSCEIYFQGQNDCKCGCDSVHHVSVTGRCDWCLREHVVVL